MSSVKTERAQRSPAERAARIRRCARALRQGAATADLRQRFTWDEIEAARGMLQKKDA